jgi:hypothetical protein
VARRVALRYLLPPASLRRGDGITGWPGGEALAAGADGAGIGMINAAGLSRPVLQGIRFVFIAGMAAAGLRTEQAK